MKKGVKFNGRKFYPGSLGETDKFVFQFVDIYHIKQYEHGQMECGFAKVNAYEKGDTEWVGVYTFKISDGSSQWMSLNDTKYMVCMHHCEELDRHVAIRVT